MDRNFKDQIVHHTGTGTYVILSRDVTSTCLRIPGVWFQSLNLLCILKSPLGGEVAGSEGGETTPAAGGAPAEGEEGKDEVVY